MTQAAGAAALPMEAYAHKQAIGDVIVNFVLTVLINGWLTGGMASIPGSLPMGNTAPNLGGTLVGIAFFQSLLLTPIVFAMTVAQRKAGKVMPPLDPGVRGGGAATRLTLLHLAVTLVGAIVLGMVIKALAPDLALSRWGFVGLAGVIAGALAWPLSRSTTRRALGLG
ncbi:hypothetical protein [Novosphingobium sp.]|uniref:hypothetical protein n=1 Tax=Novosphingobium sp. TaxID=1874826 RepID=UPI0025D2C82D|nr:hypothetical protein [Novosphingobium sp.]